MSIKRRWIYTGSNSNTNVVDSILDARNIEDKESFLNPDISMFHDFTLLEGVDKAVNRIKKAIQEKDTIILYHDYDADGIGGGSVGYLMLEELGAKVACYSNDRFTQGYGMCNSGIDEIIDMYGEDILIITIDNGISQIDAANYLKERNIDLIVTDHHEPQEELPHAEAIINPKLSKIYPFQELCGAGVIWKLLSELYPNKIQDTYKYLDIVALSTVADVVPLLDENRIIVSEGIKLIESNERLAFKVLNELTEMKEITSHYTLAYVYGPIVNAVGRLNGKVDIAVKAFISKDKREVTDLISEMIYINDKRKEMTTEQMEIAEDMIDENNIPTFIVMYNKDLHPGIVGLVAGRIKEKYNRPTIVFSGDTNGVAKGSARSIKALDMMKALKHTSHLLKGYGGHDVAAGMSIGVEDIEEFTREINKYAESILTKEDFIKEYNFIYSITPGDITKSLIYDLSRLEPYGEGFEKPLIKLNGFCVDRVFTMGEDKEHLKLIGDNISLIGWRQAEVYNERVKNPKKITALGFPEINHWNGKDYLQFVIDEDNFY